MKINYVISTYNGKNERSNSSPLPKDVLKSHLSKINDLHHNLSQITIMKPHSKTLYEDYYDIDALINLSPTPIEVIECENYGYSGGQFLKCYELYKDKFDYYIFIEDDYCANMDKFDDILLYCYNQKFSNNVGLLCSLVQGSQDYKEKGGYPIHWEGIAFLSSDTLEFVYNSPSLKYPPREMMSKIDNSIDPYFNWISQKNSYIGGYYQLTFSYIFSLSGVEHKDYLDTKYQNKNLHFPYWTDLNNDIGGKINFFNPGNTIKKHPSLSHLNNSLFIPIQLSTPQGIDKNSNLKKTPKIIFLIGIHRSGTSLLSNCLVENGYDIGINKNQDKNWQNPKGYFENNSFHDFHNELLKFNNSSWDNISSSIMKYTQNHVIKYRQLLKEEFPSSNQILIKDPRLTFFQDFLKEVCEGEYDYNFIFCTRDKKECTYSLSKSQSIPLSVSEEIYDITHNFITKDCIKINHRDILNNNSRVLNKISNFCNFELLKDTTFIVDHNLYRNKNIQNPHFLRVYNSQIIDLGQVEKLGWSKSNGFQIPDDYIKKGEFMIMRLCNGLGDWGIISSLPRMLKEKYPHCKVYLPSERMIKSLFGKNKNWTHWPNPEKNVERIFQNNPYVDQFVDNIKGEIFHDHYRIYEDNPTSLIKQMLLFWGFTEKECINYEPELYFSEEEKIEGDKIIKKYFGEEEFGGFICSNSQLKKGEFWEDNRDDNIKKELKKYPLKYVYYGGINIKETPFADYIDVSLDFNNTQIPLRIQLYIRSKAKVNIGYQSSIFEIICRYSQIICTEMDGGKRENIFNTIKYI